MANKVLFSNLGKSPKDKVINIVLILVIVVALFFAIRYLWRNQLKPLFKKVGDQNAVNQEIAQGGALSYAKSQYQNFADALYYAMKGLGTDTSTVYNVFNQLYSKADVLQLISTFGVKDNETLSEWMRGEWKLDISKINSILASKGIEYKF